MIYFDNAATTLLKPRAVADAVHSAINQIANPGRSGYKEAMRAGEIVFSCREEIAKLFTIDNPERIVFTANATHALNLAIKGILGGGGHAVVSAYEHNSVVRPLRALEDRGVSYSVARTEFFSPPDIVRAFEKCITKKTKLVVCIHVSNVAGYILPIHEIDKLCAKRGIPLVIDASQSAGVLDIDMRNFVNHPFLCMPGHKSLYGPQGTGVLIMSDKYPLGTVIEGGTGSLSSDTKQPEFLPDRFESGTLNAHGIAGLLEGVRYVREQTPEHIYEKGMALFSRLASGLLDMPGIRYFCADRLTDQSPVLSFAGEKDAEEIAFKLSEEGICTRAGLHCAPLAHESLGTFPEGTVRAAFSSFNTEKEVDRFIKVLSKI